MGKTIVEKILGHAAGCRDVFAGEIIQANISFLMTNDAVGELTIDAFDHIGSPVWNPEKVAVVLDHYIPAATENAARVHQRMRTFARTHGLHIFDQQGVCHQLMLENFVAPGDVVIGTDSHTCTYGGIGAFATGIGSTDGAAAMATGMIWLKVPETIRIELTGSLPEHVHPKDVMLKIIGELGADGATYSALEFFGEGIETISNAGRLTMCNMAIEAGAKTGIFPPDRRTKSYCRNTGNKGIFFSSDENATFLDRKSVALDRLTPQIACPPSVDNVVAVRQYQGTRIDQAFIGSCTNGRIEDLRIAADAIRGEKVAEHVRLLVTPASRQIYRQAMTEGLLETFTNAGAIICNPGCSACFGGQGMLWEGEVCIGTHNRNFKGRMGHKDARVYLASPETTARSAIAGCITDPTTGTRSTR